MLTRLADSGRIGLPYVPEGCVHNGHMFYIKCKDSTEREQLIQYLADAGIMAVFHYIPLHTAPAGLKHGRFHGEDRYTTKESERLLRLPMYYSLSEDDVTYICEQVCGFYSKH